MDEREEVKGLVYKLYEGKACPHHSCGICLATAFGCQTKAYQSLRKGGITGEGECGALKAGEMVLGEYLGDPSPTGPVTDSLRESVFAYRKLLAERVDGLKNRYPSCNDLVGGYADFASDARKLYCTELVAVVADTVAEILQRCGVKYELPR